MSEFLKNLKDHKTNQVLDQSQYNEIPYYSSSKITQYSLNPYKFKLGFGANSHKADEDFSLAKTFGSLVHLRLLEPQKFEDSKVAYLKMLTPSERNRFDAVVDSVKSNKQVQKIFSKADCFEKVFIGDHKIELEGKDPVVVKTKCRVDMISAGWIVDLKTITDTSRIDRHANQYRLDIQASFYKTLLEGLGMKVKGFIFIFLEKNYPNETVCFYCSQNFLTRGESGDEYNRGWKDLIREMHFCPKPSNFGDLQPL